MDLQDIDRTRPQVTDKTSIRAELSSASILSARRPSRHLTAFTNMGHQPTRIISQLIRQSPSAEATVILSQSPAVALAFKELGRRSHSIRDTLTCHSVHSKPLQRGQQLPTSLQPLLICRSSTHCQTACPLDSQCFVAATDM